MQDQDSAPYMERISIAGYYDIWGRQATDTNTSTKCKYKYSCKTYAQHCKTKIVSFSLCYSAIWCRYVDVWGGGVKEIQNTNTDIARSGGCK